LQHRSARTGGDGAGFDLLSRPGFISVYKFGDRRLPATGVCNRYTSTPAAAAPRHHGGFPACNGGVGICGRSLGVYRSDQTPGRPYRGAFKQLAFCRKVNKKKASSKKNSLFFVCPERDSNSQGTIPNGF